MNHWQFFHKGQKSHMRSVTIGILERWTSLIQNSELILNCSGSTHSSQECFQSVIIQRHLKWFIFIAVSCQKKIRLSKRRLYMYIHVLKYSSLTVYFSFRWFHNIVIQGQIYSKSLMEWGEEVTFAVVRAREQLHCGECSDYKTCKYLEGQAKRFSFK